MESAVQVREESSSLARFSNSNSNTTLHCRKLHILPREKKENKNKKTKRSWKTITVNSIHRNGADFRRGDELFFALSKRMERVTIKYSFFNSTEGDRGESLAGIDWLAQLRGMGVFVVCLLCCVGLGATCSCGVGTGLPVSCGVRWHLTREERFGLHTIHTPKKNLQCLYAQ